MLKFSTIDGEHEWSIGEKLPIFFEKINSIQASGDELILCEKIIGQSCKCGEFEKRYFGHASVINKITGFLIAEYSDKNSSEPFEIELFRLNEGSTPGIYLCRSDNNEPVLVRWDGMDWFNMDKSSMIASPGFGRLIKG